MDLPMDLLHELLLDLGYENVRLRGTLNHSACCERHSTQYLDRMIEEEEAAAMAAEVESLPRGLKRTFRKLLEMNPSERRICQTISGEQLAMFREWLAAVRKKLASEK